MESSIKLHIRNALGRFPVLQRYARAIHQRFGANATSRDYQVVSEDVVNEVHGKLSDSWKNDEIPGRQRALVEQQLVSYRRGEPNAVFDALVDVLVNNIPQIGCKTLLEIGCSSGYYSEVLRIKGIHAAYTGCDYSDAFIRQARELYPNVPFDVRDATDLEYESASYDVVVSGCCILHIPDFEKAVAEAARVSRQYVVFHRTPVLHRNGPITYTKKAYGVETLEIHFNEQQLVRLFVKCGMQVIDVNTHGLSWDTELGDALAMKTYLCRKPAP